MTAPATAAPQPTRSGHLTWAQQEWFMWNPVDTPASHEDNVCVRVPAHDAAPEQALAAVRDVIGRHELLRSLIVRGGPVAEAVQHVTALGAEPPGTLQLTDEDPSAEPIGPVFGHALRTPFRLGEQWPMKAVLFTRAGLVHSVAFVIDHAAIDAYSVRILREDFARALAARTADPGREPFDPAEVVEQPLDAAETEASETGAGRRRRAEEYWRGQLGLLRKSLDGYTPLRSAEARAGASEDPEHGTIESGYRVAVLTSQRAARASEQAAARFHVPVSTLFLTSFAAAIRAVEGVDVAGVFPFAANRTSEGARRSIRKAFMPTAPVVLADGTPERLAESLLDCAAQQARGQRFANTDPVATEGFCAEILGPLYQTGAAYARFNYIDQSVLSDAFDGLPTARGLSQPYDAAGEGLIAFHKPKEQGSEYYLRVEHNAACAWLTLAWHESTGWGPFADGMLWFIEETLAWAAEGGSGAAPTLHSR
jgi:hypothetical protein